MNKSASALQTARVSALVLIAAWCYMAYAQVPQPTGINMTLPANLVPTDPACSNTTMTPGHNYCPALVSDAICDLSTDCSIRLDASFTR